MNERMRSGSGQWVWLVAMAALVACEATGGDGAADPGGPDAGVVQWDSTIGGGGGSTVEDITVPTFDECEKNPGAYLCPCADNEDCYSGYCVPSSGGTVCSKTCEGLCPLGWSCKPDPTGAETSYICIEDHINLCRPCQSNDECQFFSHVGDRCVFAGDEVGSFCGTACEDDDDCRAGYGCQEVLDTENSEPSLQCIKLSGECECSNRAVSEAAVTTCLNAQCTGTRVCTDEGLSACNAPAPEAESCDGLDNNCNGQVDEGFEDTDGDGVADCVDEDDDNDGVLDGEDVCPLVVDPEQGDDDGDGIGNWCDPPAIPEFTGTEPPSPANNVQPLVMGTGEVGSVIYVYDSQACDSPEAATVVGEDGTWMVLVMVEDGVTSTLYAAAESSLYGVLSECTPEPLLYKELGDKATPEILGSDLPSPANDNTPLIFGTAEPNGLLWLYTEEGCTGDPIGEGSSDGSGNFEIEITVDDDTETPLYASTQDTCTAEPWVYVEDSTAPAAPDIQGSEPPTPSKSLTPEIVVQTEPFATIHVNDAPDCTGVDVGSAEADDEGVAMVPITAVENSQYELWARATDQAGNEGPCTTDLFTYSNDTIAPLPPVFTDSSPDSPSADNTAPILLGNCEKADNADQMSASVHVYTNHDCAGDAAAWSVATTSGVFAVGVTVEQNSETTFWGTTTDAAGNVSACSPDNFTYIHDNLLPDTPTLVATNPPSPGNLNQPTLIGVAEPLNTIRAYAGADCTGLVVGSADSNEEGDFAFGVIVSENTETLLYATATDGTGLTSECVVEGFPYVHDGINPEAPIFAGTEPASPGNSLSFAVLGTAEPHSTLTLHGDQDCAGAPLMTATTEASGDFIASLVATPNDVTHLWGRVSDGAGNFSPCTDEPIEYIHDDVPPPPPTLASTLPPSPAPTTQPFVLGTAAPEVTVEIFGNPNCANTVLGSGLSTEEGTFEIVIEVSEDGTTFLFGHAVDAAGNVSTCSTPPLDYEYDDSQPEIPQILSSTPESPANENEPTLIGIAQAQTEIMIYRNPTCEGDPEATVEADNVGDFQVSVLVEDDTTTEFYANALNTLGVFSPCSLAPFVYVEDSQEPLAPTLTHTVPAPPSNVISPVVHGQSEPDTLLTFYADSECAGDPIGIGGALGDGDFAVEATVFANGHTEIFATASDAVGNTSACSPAGLPYLHDDIPPPPPIMDATQPPSPSDTVTEPIVLASADANATVTVYSTPACDGIAMGQAQASVLGLVSIPVTVAENSATKLFGTATDEAGNTSFCSPQGLDYVHDNAVPDPPVLLGTTPESPGTESLPTVHAQAEPGATIQVFIQPGCTGFITGDGVAGPTGLANFQIFVPENAVTTLYANAVDVGGQISDCTSEPLYYEHDGIAPDPPLLVGTSPKSPSFAEIPDVLGQTEPGAEIQVWANAACTGDPDATTTGGDDGTFAAGIAAVANAEVSATARAIDAAGNVSDCSAPIVYLHDDIPPSMPILSDTSPTSPSSFLSPVVHGTSDPLSDIEIFDNPFCQGANIGFAQASAGGLFAVTVTPYENSTTNLHAQAVDAAGNISECTDALPYTHDDTQPYVPVILGSTPESPNNQSTEPLLYGTAEPNAIIRIYTNSDCTGAAEAVSDSDVIGVFEVGVQVEPNSETPFWVASEDDAENISPCSPGTFVYIHDTLTPQAPVLEGTTPESPTNESTTPTVFGTAELRGTVSVYTSSNCTGEPLAEAYNNVPDGVDFEVEVEVADNTSTDLYATVTDLAKNTSACTLEPLTYIHDTLAPDPPVLTGTTPESPSSDLAPKINGLAEPAANIRLFGNAECTGSVLGSGPVGQTGTFAIAALVGIDEETALYANATDEAGNASGCSAAAVYYTNDSTAPETPILTHTTPASPTTTDTTPTVYGTTEASVQVKLYTSEGCIQDQVATSTSGPTGTFAFVVTVPENSLTLFYAHAIDEIGNISPCSEALPYLHDNQVPDAPLLTGTDPESPGQDPTPEVLGESEAEIDVFLFTTDDCSGDPVGEGITDEVGTFAIEATSSNDNDAIVYYAHVVDGAGNISPCSEGITYVHDTTAPDPPILTETIPEPPGSHKSPGFVGTAEAGTLVKLYDEDDCSGQFTGKGDVLGDGTFTIQATVKANQVTTTHGTATDAAGNISACGAGLDYTHDDKAPAKPVILGTVPASPNNVSTSPTVFGTAEPGCAISLLTETSCFLDPAASTTTSADGNWSLVVNVPANTETPLRAYCIDDADNQSDCSDIAYYIHDTIAPEFDGIDNVVAVDEGTMVATWLPASDNFTQPFNMVYLVCVTEECGGCDGDNFVPTYDNLPPGQLGITIEDLQPDTRYYYVVRAMDEAGNVDNNEIDIAIKTPGVKMATDIAVGESQTCAILSDGSIACWGDETVPEFEEPPVAIEMGLAHSCAILRDGRMRCWGTNTSGQLGNGSTNDQPGAVEVSGVVDAVRVSIGQNHTCAVMSDGRVQCWGLNQHGQLGDGSVQLSATPANVRNPNGVLMEHAVDVACGWNHTCAAMADGSVKCWGLNVTGQLGDGTLDSSAYPTDADVGTAIREVVAGESHTCGLRVDGDVSCWGWNDFGQLGDGTLEIDPTPKPVGLYDVRQLGGGAWHVCATLTDGSGQCWGRNEFGQLGNGSAINASVVKLVAGLTDAIAIGAGSNHSCALLSDGSVRCWGANLGGELGNGGTNNSYVPVLVTEISGVSHLTHLSRSAEHGCARVSDGTLRCWGKNSSGQAGNGTTDTTAEVTIVDTPATVTVATGEFNSCALLDDGTVQCWGANTSGTVGNGLTSAPVKSPAVVKDLDGIIDLTVGRQHACALSASGGVYCWGANTKGQLGTGDLEDQHEPFEVDLDAAISIAAGDEHTCAVLSDGDVVCWGENDHGQLGTGDYEPSVWPEPVLQLEFATDVVAGESHTCARRDNGSVRCWGANGKGQIGDGTTVDKPEQTPVPALNQVTDLSAGLAHTCATLIDGSARCWGSNGFTELGDPSAGTFSAEPIPVTGLSGNVRSIEAGTYSTCALGFDGLVQCWGYNNDDFLGVKSECAAAPSPCESGWALMADGLRCTRMSSEQLTWEASQAACQDLGGDLLTITSEEDNQLIFAMSTDNYWLGLNDRTEEDVWSWIAPSPSSSYTAWYVGVGNAQPDNSGGGEDCVVGLVNTDGEWHDRPCGDAYYYACQLPAATIEPCEDDGIQIESPILVDCLP